MLGKLLKHDLKSTARVLLPLNLVLIGITILGMIILSLTPFQRPETMLLGMGMLGTYIIMIVALAIITEIYLIVSFYRSMFTHQGYLTFTLPATPWELLHSKMIAGFIWCLVNTLLTYLSVVLLLASSAGFSNFGSYMTNLFTGSLTDVPVTINGVSTLVVITLQDLLGVTLPQLLLFMVALTLISCFYSVAVGYASVSIGQLFAKHKVAGTVTTYLVIYFVMQFFCGIVAMLVTIRPMMQMVQSDITDAAESVEFVIRTMNKIYHPLFLAMLGFQLIVGIVLYIASGIIMNKKVNLD